jgi:thioredoxin 1
MEIHDGLPDRVRERLRNIGGLSEAERESAAEVAQLDELLRRFYGDEIQEDAVLEALKTYERNKKWALLRAARDKLEQSFKWEELRLEFTEREDGSMTVAKGEARETPEVPTGKGEVLELTDASFDAAVSEHALLVVDCWAVWCGPCRMVAPVIEELARDYAGRATFGKLDVDKNPATARRFQIQSIPTILVFKNGRLVDQKLGAMPRAMLEPAIVKHLERKEPTPSAGD